MWAGAAVRWVPVASGWGVEDDNEGGAAVRWLLELPPQFRQALVAVGAGTVFLLWGWRDHDSAWSLEPENDLRLGVLAFVLGLLWAGLMIADFAFEEKERVRRG